MSEAREVWLERVQVKGQVYILDKDGEPLAVIDGATRHVAIFDSAVPGLDLGAHDVVLRCEGNLNIPTTGTAKETLRSVSIPAGVFSSGKFIGVDFEAVFYGAANTNNKTPGADFGGDAVMSLVSNVSAQEWHLSARLLISGPSGEFNGSARQTIRGGTSSGNIFTVDTGTVVVDLNSPIAVDFHGTTPSAAGELSLRALRVALLRKVAG